MRLPICLISFCVTAACLGPVGEKASAPFVGAGGGGGGKVSDTLPAPPSPVPALLQQKCAECHARDGGYETQFVASPDLLRSPAKLCPDASVGECVARAAEAQYGEGSKCRTVVVSPFHREGWECLTPAEVAAIRAWVDADMPE